MRNEGVINVYRRYNEFRQLHDEANLQFPEVNNNNNSRNYIGQSIVSNNNVKN